MPPLSGAIHRMPTDPFWNLRRHIEAARLTVGRNRDRWCVRANGAVIARRAQYSSVLAFVRDHLRAALCEDEQRAK